MTVIYNHTNTSDKIQELIDLMESSNDNYKHLQVFLYRERGTDSRPDNFFLMVSPRVCGKVKLLDLKVEGSFINIEFLDCTMQEQGNIKIDIHDDRPTIFFICWQNISKMVLDETQTISNDELLELDIE